MILRELSAEVADQSRRYTPAETAYLLDFIVDEVVLELFP